MIYKGWEIEESYFGRYVAISLEDCDELMKFGRSVDELIIEIDEEL